MAPDEHHDTAFVGSVPEQYERLMVPLIFEEPARAMAHAVEVLRPEVALETAAGTGVVTRLLEPLVGVRLVATDLNEPMLATAQELDPSPRITWEVADALDLPFDDDSFDLVVCQFGVMFFPDRIQAFREAARVLQPGGHLMFTVWDRIEANGVAHVVTEALSEAGPEGPVDFLARTPHGHHDTELLNRELREAGFADVLTEPGDGTSRCTAEIGAIAYCHGTPLRAEIEAHPSLDLDGATRIATEALVRRYGGGEFDAPTRWFLLEAELA
ncbi:MAG TPA: methyltransferase domain-containing protein [Nocardioides sp.]|nr:methyltransferase domain-containing protein [Nocardioides sp.]